MRIHAILTGRVQIKEAQIEGRGHGLWRQIQPIVSSEWAEWVPVYAWAIEHPEGVIVVDTGSGAHLKSLPRWHSYFQLAVRFDIEPEQEVGPQLRSLGIGERDVKTVVLTHLHIDHDGGLSHSPIAASASTAARSHARPASPGRSAVTCRAVGRNGSTRSLSPGRT
jgi:glyoxylase-like metal-dependent hydrolase (beta-lactamase superfamily II)